MHTNYLVDHLVIFKDVLRGLVPCAHWAIFKRLSLGGYGDLACIKSIWADSSSSGDKFLRLAMSNRHVYSRVAPVNMAKFPSKMAKSDRGESLSSTSIFTFI